MFPLTVVPVTVVVKIAPLTLAHIDTAKAATSMPVSRNVVPRLDGRILRIFCPLLNEFLKRRDVPEICRERLLHDLLLP
jgi:hypothetical protein